jgi:uncharacterized alpha-E superfamily protein
MTEWIEHYRERAEERYRRLDAVLADLADHPDPPNPAASQPS